MNYDRLFCTTCQTYTVHENFLCMSHKAYALEDYAKKELVREALRQALKENKLPDFPMWKSYRERN